MVDTWVIVDNVLDIGINNVVDAFQAYKPKRIISSHDGSSASIQFLSKEEARDAFKGINNYYFYL